MSTRTRLLYALVAAFTLISAPPARAAADATVAVLGLRAPDGDDQVARELTQDLRDYASRIPGWQLEPSEVSLEQLMLLQGCAEPDLACLAQIASDLQADHIISGAVERIQETGSKRHDFQTQIFYFNSRTRRIDKRVRAKIPYNKSSGEHLEDRARRYITRFAGKQPAERVVEVASESPSRSVSGKSLQAPTDSSAPRLWPAVTTFTMAGAFLGLTAWSWVTIKNVESDPAFRAARIQAGPGVNDICSGDGAFRTPEVNSLCNKANRHETLQWVFLGGAVLSTGIGTWLLVRHLRGKKRSKERASLRVSPSFSNKGAAFSAQLDF